MLLQDLLAYLFVFALAILIVVQVVRSIRNARRVRLGFNAGICADCNTRWHHEYDYAGEDHQYRCKCGKHTLPTSSFVDCALIPEPTAELHEAMLEQLMVQEDRRILGTMQAAAEGAPLCRG
jgi:hypothetical protein